MDRGVKIAIFVASIISLALGLIWDQVLNSARVAVQQEAPDELGPETMQARMGSPEIPRAALPADFDARPVDEPLPQHNEAPAEPDTTAQWTEYTVAGGDSWWKLAHKTFKDRGLEISDLQGANPGVQLKPGEKLRIPPFKGAQAGQATPAPKPTHPAQPATSQPAASSAVEYTVVEGDSWWKIAYVHFKSRGVTTEQLQAANPGVALRAGARIKVP
ncbi:MAG: LysM peptidoglycan-binding domain-containing protein [Planctomycetes bacterium]|nr:LysM peptidoglycan-binding domain-containing protein [Planctomycetota bacterium]MCW8134302.1 LysM peptidoglycan-binding domain-containing protein [Planctomycetota bacterium]